MICLPHAEFLPHLANGFWLSLLQAKKRSLKNAQATSRISFNDTGPVRRFESRALIRIDNLAQRLELLI
jgi:hypothetical protein